MSVTTYAPRADEALTRLAPLTHIGYTLEHRGECILVSRREQFGCRYVTIKSVLDESSPCQYVLAMFAGRW